MDERTQTTSCARLRFVQYCLNFKHMQVPMRMNVTSKRIPKHPGINVKSGLSQRLFPVMKGPGISKFCL